MKKMLILTFIFCLYAVNSMAICNNHYNKSGKIQNTKCDDNWNTSETKYDDKGHVIEESTQSKDGGYSYKTNYKYDADGKLLFSSEREFFGEDNEDNYYSETKYKYDNGKLISEQLTNSDGYSSETKYKYDDHGNVIEKSQSDSDGYSYKEERSYGYYDNGNIKTVEGENGILEKYDENGLLIEKYRPYSRMNKDGTIETGTRLEKSFEYDDKGRLIKENLITQSGGCSGGRGICYDYVEAYSEYKYGDNGNIKSEITANVGGTCTYYLYMEKYNCQKGYTENTYDENGNISATYTGRTNISNSEDQSYTSRDLKYKYGYDDYGNLINKYDADGNILASNTYENPTYNATMRIYTVPEANMATTPDDNTVFIRYK